MTTSADLILAFADRVELPVPLDDVAQWLLNGGFQDEIYFIPVDLDVGVIRGYLRRRRRRKHPFDIDTTDISEIFYDQSQEPEWINVVCAKELLHILDQARCSSREEFEKLTASLALPNTVKHLLESPDYVLVDKFGALPACALLLPIAARDLLLPAYEQGVVTEEAISEMAMLPVQFVRTVMSPEWPTLYAIITASATKPDIEDDQMNLGLNGAVSGEA